jgi:hypothetical protein
VNFQTVGGWALLINATLAVFLLIYQAAGEQNGVAFLVVGEVLTLLLIVGLFALWPMVASAGRMGQVGLWCLGSAAAVAFFVRLALLLGASDVSDLVPLASAILGCAGGALVGWATIQSKTFNPIIGWLLIVSGALNLSAGLFAVNSLMVLLGVASMLAQAGAFAGYGWTLLRQSTVALR